MLNSYAPLPPEMLIRMAVPSLTPLHSTGLENACAVMVQVGGGHAKVFTVAVVVNSQLFASVTRIV